MSKTGQKQVKIDVPDFQKMIIFVDFSGFRVFLIVVHCPQNQSILIRSERFISKLYDFLRFFTIFKDLEPDLVNPF